MSINPAEYPDIEPVVEYGWEKYAPHDTFNPGVEIVCLCGSTRFKDAFAAANTRFTFEGKIVLTMSNFTQTDEGGPKEEVYGPDVALMLDRVYLNKIWLSHRVFVINVGGYIGASTRREIRYAKRIGRKIEYLESINEEGPNELE